MRSDVKVCRLKPFCYGSEENTQLSSGAKGMHFGLSLHERPSILCVSSIGSGETVWMYRLV